MCLGQITLSLVIQEKLLKSSFSLLQISCFIHCFVWIAQLMLLRSKTDILPKSGQLIPKLSQRKNNKQKHHIWVIVNLKSMKSSGHLHRFFVFTWRERNAFRLLHPHVTSQIGRCSSHISAMLRLPLCFLSACFSCSLPQCTPVLPSVLTSLSLSLIHAHLIWPKAPPSITAAPRRSVGSRPGSTRGLGVVTPPRCPLSSRLWWPLL